MLSLNIRDTGERKCFQSVCRLKDLQLLNGLMEVLVFTVVASLFIPHVASGQVDLSRFGSGNDLYLCGFAAYFV